jgi:hypothetical protein
MLNPFFVELGAMHLTQNIVFQDSSAPQDSQTRNKKEHRTERY